MKNVLDFEDYPKALPIPLILPEYILSFPDLEDWQKEALQNNKIVLIKDYWCVLSRRLPVAPHTNN